MNSPIVTLFDVVPGRHGGCAALSHDAAIGARARCLPHAFGKALSDQCFVTTDIVCRIPGQSMSVVRVARAVTGKSTDTAAWPTQWPMQ
jgi:hypothetical protein